MLYIILYRYRYPTGRMEIRAHVKTFDDLMKAEAVLAEERFSGLAWIVETPRPDLKPQISLVNDYHKPSDYDTEQR